MFPSKLVAKLYKRSFNTSPLLQASRWDSPRDLYQRLSKHRRYHHDNVVFDKLLETRTSSLDCYLGSMEAWNETATVATRNCWNLRLRKPTIENQRLVFGLVGPLYVYPNIQNEAQHVKCGNNKLRSLMSLIKYWSNAQSYMLTTQICWLRWFGKMCSKLFLPNW